MSGDPDSFGNFAVTIGAIGGSVYAFQLFSSVLAAVIGGAIGFVVGFVCAYTLAMLLLILVGVFGSQRS